MMKDGVFLTPIPSEHDFSDYLCSTVDGRIWSKRNERFLESNPNSNGYCYVTLIDRSTGKSFSYGIHRLVMCSFTSIPLERFKRGGIEIDHLDESLKHVNGIHNLQMCTRVEQYKESTREKMRKGKKRLSEAEVCEILSDLQEWLSDKDTKISEFIHMTAEAYDQTYRSIWNIVYGKSWKYLSENIAL